MSGIQLPAALDRLFSRIGARLDRGEAWLHRAFGAETRTDRLLIGMAFNFLLVMAVVLPVDLLFRKLTEGPNSLLPLQQFITWVVFAIESALGIDVIVCGANGTQLCYTGMVDLEIISSCSGLHETIFRDAAPEETYRFLYRILGIDEADWDALPGAGFSADYVSRETKRCLAGVEGVDNGTGNPCEIWPGIDVDIPVSPAGRDQSPQDVEDAVVAAFEAGAQGVVLSRKYSEMRLANLAGCGAALKRLA